MKQNKVALKIELVQANGKKYWAEGILGGIQTDSTNQTTNVYLRADFQNPDGQLHHGQTGAVLISRVLKNVIAIPKKATFEVDDKRYVYVVDTDDVASRRLINIRTETEDQAVVGSGIDTGDRIVITGVKLIRDGQKVVYEKH